MPIYVTSLTLIYYPEMKSSFLPSSTRTCTTFRIDSRTTQEVSLSIFLQDLQEVMCPGKDMLQPRH
jgi:hypothetical protein